MTTPTSTEESQTDQELDSDGNPKLNGATVPEPMSPLETLKAKYAQEVASELASLDWAGDPAGSAVKLGQITATIDAKAAADIATTKKAEVEKEATAAKVIDAMRGTGLLAFKPVWDDFAKAASKLSTVKVWTYQVQVDETKPPRADGSVYYQEPTLIAGYAKKPKASTGEATTRTPNPTARQPVEVKIKGADTYTSFTSAAAAKVALLGVDGPMNKATVIEKLTALGHEVKA